jgi:Glycosyl transferase family 2
VSRISRNLSPRTWLTRAHSARNDLRDVKQLGDQVASVTARTADDVAAQREAIDSLRSDLAAVTRHLTEISSAQTEQRQRLLLALRMVRDDDASARRELLDLRRNHDYHDAFEELEPLVSVVIPTYKNWALLRDRSLPSVLAQTYQNWECIVVGDCAPAETSEVVESFGDDRIQFTNLPYRGPYPDDPKEAWMISGTPPLNAAFALAKGKWIATNADDDALRPEAIDLLLQHARRNEAEVAYGYIEQKHPDDTVTRLGVFPPRFAQWGMQGSLIHAGLRFLPLLPSDWVFEIPNDMSLMERMLRIGVRFSMMEQTTVDYYPSTLWGPAERLLWEDEGRSEN